MIALGSLECSRPRACPSSWTATRNKSFPVGGRHRQVSPQPRLRPSQTPLAHEARSKCFALLLHTRSQCQGQLLEMVLVPKVCTAFSHCHRMGQRLPAPEQENRQCLEWKDTDCRLFCREFTENGQSNGHWHYWLLIWVLPGEVKARTVC